MNNRSKLFSLALVATLIIGVSFAAPFGLNSVQNRNTDFSVFELGAKLNETQKARFNGQYSNMRPLLNSFDRPVESDREPSIRELPEERLEEIKSEVPASVEDARDKITSGDNLVYEFILSDHSGENVVSGTFGNGVFLGMHYELDNGQLINTGEYVWGLYQNGNFWGFYDQDDPEFFYGKYKGPHWVARNLFEPTNWGTYQIFP